MPRKSLKPKKLPNNQESVPNLNIEPEVDYNNFKVQKSSNSIIDSELGRLWDVVKQQDQREQQILKSLNELETFTTNFENFKNKFIVPDLNKNDDLTPEIDNVKLMEMVQKEVFESDKFNSFIVETIGKQMTNSKKIKITLGDSLLEDTRIEFGYGKKGNVIFYNQAFEKVFFSMPSSLTLVSNTGFVALEDTYWLVVGE